jgi:hypothetical protein
MCWRGWAWIACVAAAGVVAYWMHSSVWWDGYQGRYGWLLACNFLRFPVIFVTVAGASYFGSQLADQPVLSVATGWRTPFGLISFVLVGFMCLVGNLIVPVIATVCLVCLVRLVVGWKRVKERRAQHLALAFGFCCMVFLFVAFELSALTHQALLGFRQRIEEQVDPEELRAWAAKATAGGLKPLDVKDMPPFLVDLMGHAPGWPVAVPTYHGADDPCILVANGSGFGLGVEIHLKNQEPEPMWFDNSVPWKPGIYLTTVSK